MTTKESNDQIRKEYPIQDDIWPSRRWKADLSSYEDMSGGEETPTLQLHAINWGEVIQLRDSQHNEVALINAYGDRDKGLPSEEHRAIADLICTAVNAYNQTETLTTKTINAVTKNYKSV